MQAFQNTKATEAIFKLKKRIRVASGGTWASKTISILIWLIDYGQSTENEVMTVVAESVPHLKLGAIRDFKSIMQANGYWDEKQWNQSDFRYTFNEGTILEFISFDKFGKAHGPRRDILFVNEANNLPYNIVDQLITRTRKIVWMDWNPTSEFWFYTEMQPHRKDIDFLTLTYKDVVNPKTGETVLEKTAIDEIESHRYNKNWWKVYGQGLLGELEGKIFTGWKTIDEIPHEARLERYGLDFGYTNDPTALVGLYYLNGGYILDEITYLRGLSNKQIADIILNQPRKALCIADSAEPKSIDEIKSFDVSIQPAEKGKDSVNYGIQVIQAQQISMTKRSLNLIKEYRNYMWQKDKEGRIINVPEIIWNHCMDATRYAMTSLLPVIQRDEFIKHMPRFVPIKRKLNPAR